MSDEKEYSYKTFEYNKEEVVNGATVNKGAIYECANDNSIPNGLQTIANDYADSTFAVGNNKAFQIIVDEFYDTLSKANVDVNKFLDDAYERMDKVIQYMEQDNQAKKNADAKYSTVMKDKSRFTSSVWSDEHGAYIDSYDEEGHKSYASGEAEKVWIDERCELW